MERNCTKHKRWFISGVSSGVGRALAELALENGHFVAGVVRDAEAARRFEATAPGRSLAYWCDVGSNECLKKHMCCCFKALGGLDVLVNNAGYGLAGDFLETSDDELRSLFEVQFWGSLRAIRNALPHFKEHRKGHIINLTCTYPGGAGWTGASASAAALGAFSEALAAEMEPYGVQVSRLDLGPVDTGWAHRVRRMDERVVVPEGGIPVEEAARRIFELAHSGPPARISVP